MCSSSATFELNVVSQKYDEISPEVNDGVEEECSLRTDGQTYLQTEDDDSSYTSHSDMLLHNVSLFYHIIL